MKLKIISDGLCNSTHGNNGTRLVTEDGEEIEGVVEIEWRCVKDRYLTRCTVELIGVAVEAEMPAGLVTCRCNPASDEVVCTRQIKRSIAEIYPDTRGKE